MNISYTHELLEKNLQFIQKYPDRVNTSVEQIKKICTNEQHYQQEKHSWLLSRSNEKTLKINQTFIHSNRSPKQETKRISHFLIEQKKNILFYRVSEWDIYSLLIY